MHVRQLVTDDDAVAPVIAVVLLVTIAVVIAAIVASFALGIGKQTQQPAPSAVFAFKYENVDTGSTQQNWGVVTVSHDGGDAIDYRELHVRGTGFNGTDLGCAWGSASREAGAVTDTCTAPSGQYMQTAVTAGTEVHLTTPGQWDKSQTTGEDTTVIADDHVNVYVAADYELRLVYEARKGSTTSTLASDSGSGS